MSSLTLSARDETSVPGASLSAARLRSGAVTALRALTGFRTSHAAALPRGHVLLSLGNPHWTPSAVREALAAAARLGCVLDWHLLDACEASSLVNLHSFDQRAAEAAVASQAARLRDVLESAGVEGSDISLASDLALSEPFGTWFGVIREAYRSNPRFASAARNQVFSNLQPKLRRVGITSNRDPRLELLVEYLLRELAIKATLASGGRRVEFGLKGEMPLWRQLTLGGFAGLEGFGALSLRHEAISAPEEPPPLVVQDLSCSASGRVGSARRPLVNDVHDVSFSTGGVTALVGPSGAGKTTLLRAIAGHIPATGSLRLRGRDVAGLPVERRGVVTVFQDFGLFPHLNGLQNVAEGARRVTGRGRAERFSLAARQLAELGVEHCAGRLPRMMSGGEQQRLAIARALVAQPELLLLDEPTAAIDQLQRAGLRDLLRRLRTSRPDLAIILVSHDVDFACMVADRLGVMDGGRLLAFGDSAAVLARPRSRRVALILGNHNIVGEPWPGLGLHSEPDLRGSAADDVLSVSIEDRLALIPHDAVQLCTATGRDGRATLTAVTCLGATVRFDLLTAGGIALTGVALARSFPDALQAGSEVGISIDRDAISYVPRDG